MLTVAAFGQQTATTPEANIQNAPFCHLNVFIGSDRICQVGTRPVAELRTQTMPDYIRFDKRIVFLNRGAASSYSALRSILAAPWAKAS